MATRRLLQSASLIEKAVAAFAGSLILLFAITARFRLAYPYELEWIEGGIADGVRRVLVGQPLYAAPDLSYVPFMYTPLYFYAGAAAAKVFGMGFMALRLVALAASLGCMALIAVIVGRETGGRRWGVIAAGLFAASYVIGGAWFDVARADSLCLLLFLAAVLRLRSSTSWAADAAAGLLIGLAFLSKQVALTMALPLVLHATVFQRRWALPLAAIVVIGGSTLLLDSLHGGWYRFFVFDLPAQKGWEPSFLATFWTRDLFQPMPIALALTLLFFLIGRSASPGHGSAPSRSDGRWFFGHLFVGMVGSAWLLRVHVGGWDNVLIPAYAALAMGGAMGAHALSTWFERRSAPPGGSATWAIARLVVPLALTWQLAMRLYDPTALIPTAADRAAGDRLTQFIAQSPGDVWTPNHGFISTYGGKPTFMHTVAAIDIKVGTNREVWSALERDIERALSERRFAVIVLDDLTFAPYVTKYYQRVGRVFEDDAVFWPVTGSRVRPKDVFVPVPLATTP